MQRKILWISPSSGVDSARVKRQYLEENADEETIIEVRSMPRGPRHLEYQYYCALAIPDILHAVKQAERDGFHAAIIGGFYDLGLREAREITENLVVVGPAEACMHIAGTIGDGYSIIVGHKRWAPTIRDCAVSYGLHTKLVSVRSIHMDVLEFHQSPEIASERINQEARSAVDADGAEVIILGCTALHGFYATIQAELSVPVLDPVLAPLSYAEYLVDIRHRFGWAHSKVCRYTTPPSHEILEWGLPDDYGFSEDLWRSEPSDREESP